MPCWAVVAAVRGAKPSAARRTAAAARATIQPSREWAVRCCTTWLENTHRTELAILYRWHPWFGLRISVHDAMDKSDGAVFRFSLVHVPLLGCAIDSGRPYQP